MRPMILRYGSMAVKFPKKLWNGDYLKNVILKAMKALVEQLEKKFCSLQSGKSLLENTSEEQMREYSEKNTVVVNSVRKPEERIATHLVGTAMRISRNNPN